MTTPARAPRSAAHDHSWQPNGIVEVDRVGYSPVSTWHDDLWTDVWLTIYAGDCRDVLAELPDESVHCVVTSPPYWGLRDYGVADQLGLEPTPEQYVANMVAVFREVRRGLRRDGTLWLNLGDSYSGSRQGAGDLMTDNRSNVASRRRDNTLIKRSDWAVAGLKPKDLVGIPWRVAFALQADGWYLRSDIIWSKPNPMPESVADRPTKSHEYLFLLSRSERYHYDAAAITEPAIRGDEARWDPGTNGHGGGVSHAGTGASTRRFRTDKQAGHGERHAGFNDRWFGQNGHGVTRNRRSVWTIPTRPYPGAHFAVFPPDLVVPCILAGAPEGGVVLDPFAGTGTTGMVAQRLSRRAVLIDLNPEYIAQQLRRNAQTPLGLAAAP